MALLDGSDLYDSIKNEKGVEAKPRTNTRWPIAISIGGRAHQLGEGIVFSKRMFSVGQHRPNNDYFSKQESTATLRQQF